MFQLLPAHWRLLLQDRGCQDSQSGLHYLQDICHGSKVRLVRYVDEGCLYSSRPRDLAGQHDQLGPYGSTQSRYSIGSMADLLNLLMSSTARASNVAWFRHISFSTRVSHWLILGLSAMDTGDLYMTEKEPNQYWRNRGSLN